MFEIRSANGGRKTEDGGRKTTHAILSRMRPATLGELKRTLSRPPAFRSVKNEIRSNLMAKLARGEELFPGIVGYDETVVPGIVNALLSRHNLVLLGRRGQAKSRILRALVEFLDEEIYCIDGCEIRDDPFSPICGRCRRRVLEEGDSLPLATVRRQDRYVEKLATPDVTIADMIGDLDPIKAARRGRDLADHENIHFGLIPRAHRGIFAINELPDLAPKIQVGLFNIMQEGDVQIKGFPIRLPLDVMLVFSANPEDYTARGKLVTPLKDRIGSEIRTHYPEELDEGIAITRAESWWQRGEKDSLEIPDFVREVVEQIAFEGRIDKRIDSHSGVSQRLPIAGLENCVSNAEKRSVVRVADIFAALPAITGKIELEYEGELKGAEAVARQLVEKSVAKAFRRRFAKENFERIIQWFELGGELRVGDQTSASDYLAKVESIQGVEELLDRLDIDAKSKPERAVATIEFVLEGLCSTRQLSRSEERGYFKEAVEQPSEEVFSDLARRRSLN